MRVVVSKRKMKNAARLDEGCYVEFTPKVKAFDAIRMRLENGYNRPVYLKVVK